MLCFDLNRILTCFPYSFDKGDEFESSEYLNICFMFGISLPWTKADFSEKNRISVVLEKILGWKNREKKIGEKSPIFPIKTDFSWKFFFF